MKLPVFLWMLAAPAISLAADPMAVGLTRTRAVIAATSVSATTPDAPVVLIVGGLDGPADALVTNEVNRYAARKQRPWRLLAIAQANPNHAPLIFPPSGQAYRDNPGSHYLWRWIGMQAPDLVLVADHADPGLADALSRNIVAGVGRIPARRIEPGAALLSSLPPRIPKSEAHLELERRLARTPQQIARQLAEYYGHDLDDYRLKAGRIRDD